MNLTNHLAPSVEVKNEWGIALLILQVHAFMASTGTAIHLTLTRTDSYSLKLTVQSDAVFCELLSHIRIANKII